MENNRENVGLLGSTRVGSRRVIQISAGFMIFFSMLGKWLIITYISSLLNVIFKLISWFLQENSELCLHQFPSLCSLQYIAFCLVLLVSIMTSHFNTILWHFLSLLSAYDCWYTFLFPASVGLSFLQFTNMNSMRNLFITGVAFFLGLSVPEYFREYTAKALHGPAHTRAGWVSLSFHQYSGLYPTLKEK